MLLFKEINYYIIQFILLKKMTKISSEVVSAFMLCYYQFMLKKKLFYFVREKLCFVSVYVLLVILFIYSLYYASLCGVVKFIYVCIKLLNEIVC